MALLIALLVVLALFAVQAARAARPVMLVALGVHITLVGGIVALDERIADQGVAYVAVAGGLVLTLVALIREHADREWAEARQRAAARRRDPDD